MSPEDRLRGRFKRLLDDAVKLARERGAADPQIYFECENGLVVTDGDHHAGNYGDPQARRDSITVSVGWPRADYSIDVGAW